VPFETNTIFNELMCVTVGRLGTYTFGGGNITTPPFSPCFEPPGGAKVVPIAGKFTFSNGLFGFDTVDGSGNVIPHGSLQQYSQFFHNANMGLTFGSPDVPAYCYANLIIDGKNTFFGGNTSEFFTGFSNRYIFVQETDGPILTNLQVELVADAVRFRWGFTNGTNAVHNIGLWFGAGATMLTDEADFNGLNYAFTVPPFLGADASGFVPGLNADTNGGRIFKFSYVYLPNNKPPDTDVKFDRALNAATFPPYVDFLFGQTDAFGFRIENEPSAATDDIPANKPTKATQMTLGKGLFVIDDPASAAPLFPDLILPDTGFLDEACFVQKFPAQQMLGGATIQFLNYVRTNWGNSNYALPFGATVDAPHVVQVASVDYNGKPTVNGVRPNPMTMRVWVDNVGGFAFDQKEFPLQETQVNMVFDTPGLTFVNGNGTNRIGTVAPHLTNFTDFTVMANNNVVGDVNYTCTIEALAPGPITKIIQGTITFGARPRLNLYPGPNLITAPFVFADSAWSAILAPFVNQAVLPGASIQTYVWDPKQQGYVISLGAERGRAAWVIYNRPTNVNVVPTLQNFLGTPSIPPGFNDSSQLVQLSQGWNMIANPFNYPVPINQINGVSASQPQIAHTFQELVSLGVISNFVAFYDPVAKTYQFVDGTNGLLQPNTGYWIDVFQQADLTLSYPSLFLPGIPESSRAAKVGVVGPQGKNLWQTQLIVKHDSVVDGNNYIGTVASAADVNRYRIFKAPMAPRQTAQIAVVGAMAGKTNLLARSYSVTASSYKWTIVVDSATKGPVQITMPQLAAVPANFQVRLDDPAINGSQDMRKATTYTYTAAVGRRTLTIAIGPPPPLSLATVGDQMVMYGSTPVYVISYSLYNPATTTVTILKNSGAVVKVLQSNKADHAGSSSVIWNLLDATNHRVPSGIYIARVDATISGTTTSKTAAMMVQ
jgi:hypothetical protein